ncbi:S-locus-specific glycoprotein S13-like [Rutidosis leptorrhynchoides]|uniref:S-locus-specific glycoprotein S13-like n=1 Tax=Rutidosis leptorrhynchoides TaxID=125765 RepID=UPI003A992E44
MKFNSIPCKIEYIFHIPWNLSIPIPSDSNSFDTFHSIQKHSTSQTGPRIFELGFFRPDNTENRYLGIWYKKISPRTIVWVANRNQPLPGASPLVLKIVDPGVLSIFNNISMTWSSNATMTSANATAKLLDTGNLVLMDQQGKMMWQSFDYPTDTLLYHMKLGRDYTRGIEWHLSSWKTNQDPAPGDFTWGADAHGYPESKLKQGGVVKFRARPWRNNRGSDSKFDKNLTLIYSVVINEREEPFTWYVENSSLIGRLTLSSSGELQYWAWPEDGNKWLLGYKFPINIFDKYNFCGAYGTNSADPNAQSCACLDEKRFVPKNQKRMGNGRLVGWLC